MEPYIGEIRLFPWEWAPEGWLLCQGQILQVTSYIALYSLLGKTYGGDGMTTFAVPDLRGRVALGVNYIASAEDPVMDLHPLGTVGGSETFSLPNSSLLEHYHLARVSTSRGKSGPFGNIPAVSSNSVGATSRSTYTSAKTPLTTLNFSTVEPTLGAPMANMQPSIVGNFCIAVYGNYPAHQQPT